MSYAAVPLKGNPFAGEMPKPLKKARSYEEPGLSKIESDVRLGLCSQGFDFRLQHFVIDALLLDL